MELIPPRDFWRPVGGGGRYFELENPQGAAGAYAKDLGIRAANGDYVCFWDDDNLYEPHALATLYTVAHEADIGIVRVQHRLRTRPDLVTVPRRWGGHFLAGDVDTMCVCVKKTLAIQESWGDGQPPPGTDYRWLQKLEASRPTIRYVPTIIGYHL